MSIARLTSATAHYPPVMKNDLLAIAARPMIAFSTIGSSLFHSQFSVQGENQVKSSQANDIPPDGILTTRCMLKPCLSIMAEVRDEAGQLISLNTAHYTARLNPKALTSLLTPLAQDIIINVGTHSHFIWMAGMSQRLTLESLSSDVVILQNVFESLNLPYYPNYQEEWGARTIFYQRTSEQPRVISDI